MRRLLLLVLAVLAHPLHAATITYGAASGNWSDATKWVGSATPTTSDDVLIDVTSGAAVTIDTSTCVAKSLTCTGYTGNIRFETSQRLSVSGTVLFAATHTLTGTGTLSINATSTITMGGLVFPGSILFSSASTFTLAEDLNITGELAVPVNLNFVNISGAFNISCSTLSFGGPTILNLFSGTTITVSSAINISGNRSSLISTVNNFATLKASTASSSVFLVYTGPISSLRISGANITDINATGSTVPIWNYFGGTLTRTSNIFNVNLPSNLGAVYQ